MIRNSLPNMAVLAVAGLFLWLAAPVAAQKVAPDEFLRMQAAKELVQVAQTMKDIEDATPMLLRKITKMMVVRYPQMKSVIKDVFAKIPVKSDKRSKELNGKLTKLYAQELTTADMKKIIALYRREATLNRATDAALLETKLMAKFNKIASSFQIVVIKQFVQEAQVELRKRAQAK